MGQGQRERAQERCISSFGDKLGRAYRRRGPFAKTMPPLAPSYSAVPRAPLLAKRTQILVLTSFLAIPFGGGIAIGDVSANNVSQHMFEDEIDGLRVAGSARETIGTIEPSNVLFADPWEKGITGGAGLWRGLHDGGKIERVQSNVRHGDYAVKVTVAPGDKWKRTAQERYEVVHPQHLRTGSAITTEYGQTLYHAFSVQLPHNWNPIGYVLVWNTHSPDGQLQLNVTNQYRIETWTIRNGKKAYEGHRLSNGGLNTGRWTDFVIKAKPGIAGNGEMEVWRRDEGEARFASVLKESGIDIPAGKIKHGLYRKADPYETYELYLDGITIATTFKDAALAAFGGENTAPTRK